jgi:hypothetical protein
MFEVGARADIFVLYSEEDKNTFQVTHMAHYAGSNRSGHICRERLACFTPSLITSTNARSQET